MKLTNISNAIRIFKRKLLDMECAENYFLHNFQFKNSGDFNENLLKTGTSIYEVIKVERGLPVFLENHLNRLFDSADISNLKINESYCDFEKLIAELIKKNEVQFGKLKIMVHFENIHSKPEKNLLIYFTPHSKLPSRIYENGVKVGICDAIRINPNAKIYNSDARKRANQRILNEKLFEVLLVDNEGFITEGSRSNIFFIQDNQLLTPPQTDVLNGITRQKIIEICKQNDIPLSVKKLNYSEIHKIDALFLTGTSIKVLPVKSLEKFQFNNKHILLKKMMQLYSQSIEDYLTGKN